MKTQNIFWIFLIITALVFCSNASTQWSRNSKISTPVCTKSGDQIHPIIAHVGNGNTVICWRDSDKKNYIQKLNSAGEILWDNEGSQVFNRIYDQGPPCIVSDGYGGAFVANVGKDDLNIYGYVLAIQRISDQGIRLWNDEGAILDSIPDGEYGLWMIDMVTDNNNGAIVLYRRDKLGADFVTGSYYVAKINSEGVIQKKKAIITIDTEESSIMHVSISDDGLGEALITYERSCHLPDYYYENVVRKIYAMKVDFSADTYNECKIAESDSMNRSDYWNFYQAFPEIIKDGTGGGIVVWKEKRSSSQDHQVELYAQRIDQNCLPQWNTNGIPVANIMEENSVVGNIELAPVSTGGTVVVWHEDVMQGTLFDAPLRAQRLDNDGNQLWGDSGLSCLIFKDGGIEGWLNEINLINDSNDQFLISFTATEIDPSSINYIAAKKIDLDRNTLWGDTRGTVICDNNDSNPSRLCMVSDGSGGTVMVWIDNRNGNKDIYAQRIMKDGKLGMSAISFGENKFDKVKNVTYDTYIRTGWKQEFCNYGAEGRIRVGNKLNQINRALIKFDFLHGLVQAGVLSSDDIVSAKLKLYVDYGRGDEQAVNVNRLLKDWGEGIHENQYASVGEATWADAKRDISHWNAADWWIYGDREREIAASAVVGTTAGWHEWDITTSVKKIFNEFRNFGWLLKSTTEDLNENFILFKSQDNANNKQRPRLIIEYMPSVSPNTYQLAKLTFGESGDENFKGVTYDSYIDGYRMKKDYNFGSTKLIRVGNDVFNSSNNYRPNRTLIKFDFISGLNQFGISSSDQIKNAYLDMCCYSFENTSGRLWTNIFELKKDWNAGTNDNKMANSGEVTWNSNKHNQEMWDIPGAGSFFEDRGDVPIDSQAIFQPWTKSITLVSWNVTPSIQNILSSGENYGWLIQAKNESEEYGYCRLYSSETRDTKSYNRPKLTITAIVPAGLGDNLTESTSFKGQAIASVSPKEYRLSQNHPNPFNPETEIDYQIPEATHVTIKIFNTLGQEIKTLVNEIKPAGYHSVRWDGCDESGNKVVSGIYLYQIKAGEFVRTRKMALMK